MKIRLHILIYILKFYNEGCAACSGYMASDGVYECMDPFISSPIHAVSVCTLLLEIVDGQLRTIISFKLRTQPIEDLIN